MSLLNAEEIKKLLREIAREIREKPIGFASFHAFSNAADQVKRALVDADRHVQTDVLSMPEVKQADAAKLKATVTQAEKDRSITNFPTEYPLPSSQISDLRKLEEIGEITHFSKTATAIIKTPAAGKALKVIAWNFANFENVNSKLRFATSGNYIAGIPGIGINAQERVGRKCPTGNVDEKIQLYLSKTVTEATEGWICTEEV